MTTLTIPSPKSPKPNPFSKPSPVHNPFMTIVESKDELWNTVARTSSDSKVDTVVAVNTPEISGSKLCAPQQSLSSVVEDAITNLTSSSSNSSSSRVYGKIYAMSGVGSVVTGEEEEQCVLQVRAKLFKLNLKKSQLKEKDAVLSSTSVAALEPLTASVESETGSQSDSGPDWSEIGVGPVKLLRPTTATTTPTTASEAESQFPNTNSNRLLRLVMRRESKVGGTGFDLFFVALRV